LHGRAPPGLRLDETAQPNRHTRYDDIEASERNPHVNVAGCMKAQAIDGRCFQYDKYVALA